jgi:hypothetical protein
MPVAFFNLGLTEIAVLGAVAAAVVGAMVYLFSGSSRKDE